MFFFYVPLPNSSLFVERVSTAPVDSIESPIGTKIDSDDRNAIPDLHIVDHLEGRTILLDLKGPLLPVGSTSMKKVILPFLSEGGAGVESESSRSVVIETDRWGDVGRLSFVPWDTQVFIHPWIERSITILPVRTPTSIHVLDNVDEAFFFAGSVGVVIDSEHVAVLVKGDFLHITESTGIDFKVGAIGVTAKNGTLVGVLEMEPFLGGGPYALIADRPVDTAIGAHREAMHIMAGVGEVDSEAVGNGFSLIGFAIVIGVTKLPDIGNDRGVDMTIVVKDSGGDPSNFIGEAFGVDRGLIGKAIAVGIFDKMDAFGEKFKVSEVVFSVRVEILNPSFVGVAVFGSKRFVIESPLIIWSFETQIIWNPVTILSNVEIVGFASLRLCDVGTPLVVERESNWIRNEKVGRPLREL